MNHNLFLDFSDLTWVEQIYEYMELYPGTRFHGGSIFPRGFGVSNAIAQCVLNRDAIHVVASAPLKHSLRRLRGPLYKSYSIDNLRNDLRGSKMPNTIIYDNCSSTHVWELYKEFPTFNLLSLGNSQTMLYNNPSFRNFMLFSQ